MNGELPANPTLARSTLASAALALAAVAAVIGPIGYVLVTLLHPPGADANNHAVVFREYAMSQTWIALHLVQLVFLLLATAGLAGVAASLPYVQPNGRLLAFVAVGLAAASVPTAIVLQVVDGIVVKRAVDWWLAEGGSVGSASFAAARTARWLEEGLNAAFGLTMGLAVISIGAAMLRGSGYPRWLGGVGVVVGVGVLIGAGFFAATGFSSATRAWILARNPALWLWTVVAGGLLWRRLPKRRA